MKFYHSFRVREQGFQPELYEQICAMRPENRGKDDFVVESQPGDEATAALIKRLVEFCEQHSVLPAQTAGQFKAYIYQIVRHYDPEDIKSAPLLMLQTQKRMFRERLNRDGSGRLMLPARESGTSIKIASGIFNHLYVVSDSVREVLEAGELAGLLFRETVLKGSSARATTEGLWEIDSDIKLPKMKNSVLNEHSVVPCYAIDERPYRNGEPHYRQHELLPLGRFDMARTFEPLGSEPGLIVSQSFYQHCLKHKIPLEVRPVRIDPD
jgi:hypothetical protein